MKVGIIGGGETVVTFFAGIAATMITLPFAGLILLYIMINVVTKNKKRSFHAAVDLSTILFIISVNYLTVVIWEKSFLSFIILLLLIVAVLFVVLHWKIKQEIDIAKVFKGFWRFSFLLFFISYIVLIVYGVLEIITTSIV